MNSLLAELRGFTMLIAYGFRHISLLRKRPYSTYFSLLFMEAGKMGISQVGMRAIGIGTVIIAYMIKILSVNAAIAMKILVIVVMREVGPLLAAMIVLIRIGTMTSARLGMMRLHGEIRQLQLLGISPRDYLAVPTMFALALSTLVLTFYFQLIAVGGGIVLSTLLMDLSLREMMEYLLVLMTPLDIAYTAIKSFFFGLLIATVSTYYGIESDQLTDHRLPDALSRSVMQSLFVILLFNALFAYIVYGIVLFGIIRAQN